MNQKQLLNACNPEFNFDSFFMYDGNKTAYLTCKEICRNIRVKYNPIFIYSETALGKTHLLQASIQELLKERENINIEYFGWEEFLNNYIKALHNKTVGEYRNRMQRADMLIFESVNCLANKNKLQGEFFNIINSLYDNNKQIVLTSDRLPCKIKGLNSNLLSRFENMFIVKLYPPDLEARLAILKKKQEEKKIILDDEIMLFIAKRIKSNIRCLEGALISLNAFSSLTGIPVNMVNVEKLLKPFSF